MADSSHHGFDCPICFDTLFEPHALPCGHSFCGPPRKCLEALRQQQDGIICAICNRSHNLKLSDLRPLFGIRDVARDFHHKLAEVKKTRLPSCGTHAEEVLLWCVECDTGICDSCAEEDHAEHNHKSFKLVMRQKAAKFVLKIPEMASILTELDSNIQQVSSKVRELKDAEVMRSALLSELESLKEFFSRMDANAKSVEKFCNSKPSDVDYCLISNWEGKLQLYDDVLAKMSNFSKDNQTQTESKSGLEFPLSGFVKSKYFNDAQVQVKPDQNDQESQTDPKSDPPEIYSRVDPVIVTLCWNIYDIRRIQTTNDRTLQSTTYLIGQYELQLECRYEIPGPYLSVYLKCKNNREQEWCRKIAYSIYIMDCYSKLYTSGKAIVNFSHEGLGWGWEVIKWATLFDNAQYRGNGDFFIQCRVNLFYQETESISMCKYSKEARLETL